MQCWICRREARGYRGLDLRFPILDPRRYPLDWVFCSRRCQNAFHGWVNAAKGQVPNGEPLVIDPSPLEEAAIRACLKPFGEAAGAIGFGKPLSAYSQEEALAVIGAIVTAYTEAMVTEHEKSRYLPVRVSPPRSTADLADDIPW